MATRINQQDLVIKGEDLGRVLRQSTMLAQLTTRKWSAVRNDRRAVQDVKDARSATGDVGRFSKNLLAGVDQPLKNINAVLHAAYMKHREMTLPWTVDGQRLLPATRMSQYLNAMSIYVQQLQPMVNEFCSTYDHLVTQAATNLGELFDPREYPPASSIRGAFSIDIALHPVPSTTDWKNLTGFNENTLRHLAQHTVTKLEQAMRGTRDDLRQRVRDWCERAEKSWSPATGDDPDKARKFRKSVLSDLAGVVKDLEVMNLTDDPSCNECLDVLRPLRDQLGDDVETLRSSPALRAAARQDAQNVLKMLDDYAEGEAA